MLEWRFAQSNSALSHLTRTGSGASHRERSPLALSGGRELRGRELISKAFSDVPFQNRHRTLPIIASLHVTLVWTGYSDCGVFAGSKHEWFTSTVWHRTGELWADGMLVNSSFRQSTEAENLHGGTLAHDVKTGASAFQSITT